jgi:hypothetical protein
MMSGKKFFDSNVSKNPTPVLPTWYICFRRMGETYELKVILVKFIGRRAIKNAV